MRYRAWDTSNKDKAFLNRGSLDTVCIKGEASSSLQHFRGQELLACCYRSRNTGPQGKSSEPQLSWRAQATSSPNPTKFGHLQMEERCPCGPPWPPLSATVVVVSGTAMGVRLGITTVGTLVRGWGVSCRRGCWAGGRLAIPSTGCIIKKSLRQAGRAECELTLRAGGDTAMALPLPPLP